MKTDATCSNREGFLNGVSFAFVAVNGKPKNEGEGGAKSKSGRAWLNGSDSAF